MPPISNRDDNVRPYLGVGFGVIIVSTAAVLIRLAQAEVHSLVVAAWRLTLATLILTPFALVKTRSELRTLTRRDWGSAFLSGLLLAIHFATWITSLAYTSVAASVVLVWTNPIFVALASHLFLGERLTREMVIALVVAITGSVAIGLGDLGEGTHRLLGDVLAVVGALAGAGYFLIGRRLRARLSLLGYVYPVYGTAAVVLMTVMLASGLPRVPQRSETWLWLTLMALGPQILGHSSLNWALRYLSATYVTLATLVEPIGSTLLAWWLLGEPPTLWAVVGGLLILSGIVVSSRAERRAQGG
ncbi:MAG: DMT family transporter [Anaerolineae bacterium]|jgi:drug/metabolite transporter (DMT)-like permease